MNKEQIKTELQKLLENYLPDDIQVDVLYKGVPPKNDSDQLSLKGDLRLTTGDLDQLAVDISKRFSIHFPIDEAEGASTLADLVNAVAKYIARSVGAAAGLAMAIHMGQLRCPHCGKQIESGAIPTPIRKPRKRKRG